jgi:hypothetical protein
VSGWDPVSVSPETVPQQEQQAPPPPLQTEPASSAAAAAAAPLSSITSSGGAAWTPLDPGVPPPVLTSSALPLLGVSGTPGTYPVPSGLSGSLNIGSSPAAAAGLLGAGGIMAVLAAVNPTRVLVLLNALSDADLRSPAEYTDILADIAIEARGALWAPLNPGETGTVPRGALLAVRIPRPRRGESVNVVLHRKGRFKGATHSVVPGAIGLLQDSRPDDHSSRTPASAKAFFEKLLIKEGGGGIPLPSLSGIVSGAVGLLTNAPAAAAPPPPTAYSSEADASFYSTGPPTSGGVSSTALMTTDGSGGVDDEERAAAEDDARYDPFAGRTPGLGKVFLEFDSQAAAVAAQRELSGRAFNGRILVTTFADEERYRAGELCDFGMCGTGLA